MVNKKSYNVARHYPSTDRLKKVAWICNGQRLSSRKQPMANNEDTSPVQNPDWDALAHRIQKAFQDGCKSEADEHFRILRQASSKELHSVAKWKLPSEEDVEDVMAEAYIDLFRYLKKGVAIDNVRAMLHVFLVRRMVDFWRKKSGTGKSAARTEDERLRPREIVQDESFWETYRSPTVFSSRTNAVNEIEIRILLKQGMQSKHWEILELRHIYGFSTNETSEILGITISQVTKRLQEAVSAARVIIKSLESETEAKV